MFTDVLSAQQPHQFRTSPHTYRQHLNRDASIGLFRPGMVQSAPTRGTEHDGVRQGVPRSQQYVAHPIQRPSASFTQISSPDPQAPKYNDVEHMLRRKTPNGTLAAGYDGDPADLDARPHATKHMLMPMSHETGSMRDRVDNSQGYTNRLLLPQLDQPHLAQSIDGRRQSRRAEFQSLLRSEKSPSIYGAAAYQGQGVDSVLNQGAFLHHDPNLANGQHVPTVLQPMWPPCIGLTSMNNVGPYGPYWPDGAFEPYRPAPLRDPRYYHQAGSDQSKGVDSASSDMTWVPGHEPSRYPHYEERLCGSSTNLIYREGRSHTEAERVGQWGTYPFQHASATPRGHNRGSPLFHSLSGSHNERENRGQWGIADLHYTFNATFPQSDSQGSNAQFKEKVLTWAHRIYVGLLANIHNLRGNEPRGQHPAERHFPSNIYPKPPRQALFPSCMVSMQEPFGEHKRQSSVLEPGYEHPLDRHTLHNKPYLKHISTNTHGATQDLPNSRFLRNRTWGQPLQIRKQHTAFPQFRQLQSSPFYGYSESADSVQQEQKQVSAEAAVNALEMLSRLCSESGWQWTDGMLLGGCLAYGLGDLARALKWYCKVLNCDPKYAPDIFFINTYS